jgi:hypothetical protein
MAAMISPGWGEPRKKKPQVVVYKKWQLTPAVAKFAKDQFK